MMTTARPTATLRALAMLFAAVLLAFGAQAAFAQDESLVPEAGTVGEIDPAASAEVADSDEVAPGADAAGYEYYGPEMIKGQPTAFEDDALASMTFQDQYTENGEYAQWMHDIILMPIITVISLFVLGLLLWVVAKYRRREGREPSKTTHNTLVEVVWTIVPVIILVVIAVPSITLLARQYETPPADAITIKATGYQWYWGYTYPDQGGFEIISNMLPEEEALDRGLPGQLAVDNRMVVPVGVPLRIQTTAADVIHSFAVPSLWFKLDAVPGRLNERLLTINEPGIYYGQCSELCGARHGYMPIAIEAVPMERYRQWVAAQGGTFGEEEEAAPEAAPLQDPESSVPGAPGAGAPATIDTAPEGADALDTE
ncbi:cytochrome c oxidase subunit II [Erythrobacteraceae bacterium WH01K]|nr:cytochrome c oxidase subunit II [Erythrobacteraceae bacterium WH01K]